MNIKVASRINDLKSDESILYDEILNELLREIKL